MQIKEIIKKPSISEILAAFVFLPPSKNLIMKVIRKFEKWCFNLAGKILVILLKS